MINLIYSIIPVVCIASGFYFGFKVGRTSEIPKVSKETIDKIKHPIKTIKEEKEEEEQENELVQALRNLDNYDGTKSSQEEF